MDHGIGSLTSGNGVSTGPLTTTTTYKLTVTDAAGQHRNAERDRRGRPAAEHHELRRPMRRPSPPAP